jgi:type I restriction enzyme S subunit
MSKEITLYDIPENWVWSKVGDVGVVVSGGTPSTRESQFWGGEIAWITPADLSDFKEKFIAEGKRNLTILGLEYSSAILLPANTILFSSRAPIGYVAIAKKPLATNQGFKNIIPLKSTNINYLYYFLISAKNLAESLASGTTFKEISATNFSKIPIPLPPLAEQHKIVNKIEELFSELDHCVLSIKRTKEKLKIYRQHTLKESLEGKNVLKNSNFHLSWKSVKLGTVTQKISIKISPKDHPDVKFIGMDCIMPHTLTTKFTYKFGEFKSDGNSFLKDDVLYGRMRPYLNKVYKAEYSGACSGEFIVMRSLPKLDPDYLKYNLHSMEFVQFTNGKTSGDRPRISYDEISRYRILLPSIDTQRFIVNEIERKFSVIDQVTEAANKILVELNLLRHSILKKAYRGTLVKQDVDLQSAKDLIDIFESEKNEYLELQKEIKKALPKTKRKMIEKQTIEDILKSSSEPVLINSLWEKSINSDNIEQFYAELKKVSDNLVEIRTGAEVKLMWKV